MFFIQSILMVYPSIIINSRSSSQILPEIMRFLLLLLILRSSLTFWLPKILWTYWDDPITPHSTLELFYLNRLSMVKGWDVRLLNQYNYSSYLDQIPNFKGFHENFRSLSQQHKADYLRIAFIRYFGGVWIDFSSIMTEDLSWLEVDQLRNNSDVENVHGQQPDVLLFTYYKYGTNQIYEQPVTGKNYQIDPGYEIWFLAAKPNAKFMIELYEFALQRLQQNYYQVAESTSQAETQWYKMTSEQKINLRGCFGNYLLFNQIMQYLIQKKQHQLDRSQQEGLRQLAVWHYRIWHINSDKGPFSLFFDPKTTVQVEFWDLLSKLRIKQLRSLGFHTRYFIKLVGMVRRQILGHLNAYFHQPNNILQALYNTARYQSLDMINAYFCPKQYKIEMDTIFRKYFIPPDRLQPVQLSIMGKISECYDIKIYEVITTLLVIILLLTVIWMCISKNEKMNSQETQRFQKEEAESLACLNTENQQTQQQSKCQQYQQEQG